MRKAPALAMVLAVGLAAGAVFAQQNPENQVTLVAPLIVTPGVPTPRVGAGAPLYTPDLIRQRGFEAREIRDQSNDAFFLRCDPPYRAIPVYWLRVYREASDAAWRVSTLSRTAERATQKALRTRIDAAAGRANTADVEKAELDRQRTVIQMVAAELDMAEYRAQLLDIQDLFHRHVDVAEWPIHVNTESAERGDSRRTLAPKEYEDLALENIQVARQDDARAAYYKVSGTILNTRPRRIRTPPISVPAVDMFGYPLMTGEAQGKGRIGPGETQRFSYDLKPSPPQTAQLIVTFARSRRPVALEPPRCLPSDYPDHMGTFSPPLPALSGRVR